MDTQLNYYLEDLKRLDEVTVTELETLAVKFPFDQTIRLLLAEKLSFDDNSKVNADLYSSSLFKIQPNELAELNTNIINLDIPNLTDFPSPTTISDKQIEIEKMNELETIEISDDIFIKGLEDISEVEKEFEPTELIETIGEMDRQELALLGQDVSLSDMEEVDHDISVHFSEEGKEEEKPIKSKRNKEILDSTTYHNNESQNIGYTQWLLKLKPISDSKIKKVKKKKKKDKIKETAKKSIIKSDSIVSEPLANILALQGHYLEAKIMYQKLIDLNPEKKDVFKSKIIEIDQLIDQKG